MNAPTEWGPQRAADHLRAYVFPVDHPDLPVCAGVKNEAHDPATCTERGKHPATPKFSIDAVTGEREIVAMFAGVQRNYGIHAGRSRLIVFDEDLLDALVRYAAERGEQIPPTFTVRTGRPGGGRHYYFRQPADYTHVPGGSWDLPWKDIQVKAGSAYTVGPGSKHASGAYYVAENDLEPAECPRWLLDLYRPPTPEPAASTTSAASEPTVAVDVPAEVHELLAQPTETDTDRSAMFHRVVGICKRAGLTPAATAAVLTPWCAKVGKYANRVAREVDRSWKKVDDAEAAGGEGKKEKCPSQATLLRQMALERYRLGCALDGAPFAVPRHGPQVARLLRGGRASLRAELARVYAEECGGTVPSQSALADALLALEGAALQADPEPLPLRVAEHNGSLLLDLGAPDGRVVQVDALGWRILERSPVLFRRTALTGVLPEPRRPGSLKPLRDRLNVTDRDWPLVRGWLVAALMPAVPHPILALVGEQGAGKSTAERHLVCVIDPSPAPLRTAPRDVEQWAVAAAGSWIVGLDNLSGMADWLSDALCRAVTGDGLVRRQLYSNDDLAVLAFMRVIVLNGIDLGALRGDLADRLLAVELERIKSDQRRSTRAVELTADEQAEVLGGLLDLTALVLAELPAVTLDELPRMADFALVLAAIDRVTGAGADGGVPSGLARYLNQGGDLAAQVVEADAFATAVREFADQQQEWEDSASILLHLLPAPDPKPRNWPRNGQGAAAALRRAAPALRQLGYVVESGGKGTGGIRTWLVKAPESSRKGTPLTPPMPPQAADQQKHAPGQSGVPSGVSSGTPLTPLRTPLAPQAADQQKHAPGGVSGVSGVPVQPISGHTPRGEKGTA